MFIDQVRIEVEAGKGGDGISSFRREKFVALGGPSGGSGGDGGDIIFAVDLGLRTLLDFRYNRKYSGYIGDNGKSKGMHGKNAEDLILKVPPGTMIYNDETGELLYDLTLENQKEVVAKGGRGGRGNFELAKAGKHSLEISENGEPGGFVRLRLELKLIADVGLVGLPSTGKSSLISVVSKSKPKIAAYHFTTLKPNLGVAKSRDNRSFVIADLPGLIEGAHLGKGLGLQFLRHIERTKIIIHVLDMGSFEGRDPIEDFETINEELQSYKMNLENKKMIVAANKMDLPKAQENLIKFKEKFPEQIVYPISTITKEGLETLLLQTADLIDSIGQVDTLEKPLQKIYEFKSEIQFEVNCVDSVFYVTGPTIEKMIAMTNFNTFDNIRRLSNQLKKLGVEEQLKEKGVQIGDTVDLCGYQFEFSE